MPPLPNPRETVTRNALIIPADGSESKIIPKIFSEAASKAYINSFFTRTVDLRDQYRKHLDTTHWNVITSPPDTNTLKCNEGQFIMYSNISPELPVNQSAARFLAIDPNALETTLFWRGDIIVVKAENWPGQDGQSLPAHKIYHDVELSFQTIAEFVIKDLHKTNDLRQWMKVMADVARRSVQTDRFLRFGLQMQTEPIDINKRTKSIHLWKKISRYYGEAEVETITKKVCALCTSPGKPDLKVCAACLRIPYCSKECQKNDWKYHKLECKSKKES